MPPACSVSLASAGIADKTLYVRRFVIFTIEEKQMKKTALWKDASIPLKVVSCFAVILLFACSSGFPSESDGKQFLENYGKKSGQYKVKSFTKTNGVEQ